MHGTDLEKKSMQNFIFTLRQIFIFAVEADTKKNRKKSKKGDRKRRGKAIKCVCARTELLYIKYIQWYIYAYSSIHLFLHRLCTSSSFLFLFFLFFVHVLFLSFSVSFLFAGRQADIVVIVGVDSRFSRSLAVLPSEYNCILYITIGTSSKKKNIINTRRSI